MSTRMRDLLSAGLPQLRHEPTGKRIRAQLDGRTVVDTTRALLVWEPRRIVPSYAVPADDIAARVTAALPQAADATEDGGSGTGIVGARMPELSDRPVLPPPVPFTVHTSDGQAADLSAGDRVLPAAGFLPADPDLAGYVVLAFGAFDAWFEEDEPNVAHPRDPFHRIDALPSSRHVRVELDGHLLAESSRPTLLFETLLPTRYYLPVDDVRAQLTPSPTRTWCAYKGQASYWSAAAGDSVTADIGWTYREPLHDAIRVRGLIAFFNERLDLVVDGERLQRPITPWSPQPHS